MWYFTWILGVTAAMALAVINVMWLENETCLDDVECNGRKPL